MVRGQLKTAHGFAEQLLSRAQASNDPDQLGRESQIAQELAEAGLALANEHGFGLWAALNDISLGSALAQSGQVSKGIAHLEEGVKAARERGVGPESILAALALAYAHTGRAADGLRLIGEALAAVDTNGYGQHCWEPQLYRIKGELLISLDPSSPGEAEH